MMIGPKPHHVDAYSIFFERRFNEVSFHEGNRAMQVVEANVSQLVANVADGLLLAGEVALEPNGFEDPTDSITKAASDYVWKGVRFGFLAARQIIRDEVSVDA